MYNGYSVDYNNKKTKVFAILLIILAIGCFGAYFYFNSESIDDIELLRKLVGTWKSTKQTEASKDGVYVIPNVVLQINNDGTCHYKGTFKLRYTSQKGGSTIGSDYDCKLEINKVTNQIRLVPNNENDSSFYFHKNYANYELTDNVLKLSGLEYVRTSSDNDTNSDNSNETTNDNSIVGTWYYSMDGNVDYTTYYVFNADGTGNYFLGGEPINIKYKIEGDSLFINALGINSFKENKFTVNNNMLTITVENGDIIFIKK